MSRKQTCEIKNGVRRPYQGTVGETVWAICASLPQPPKRKLVIELAHKEGILPGTASCRYNDYRKFHAYA